MSKIELSSGFIPGFTQRIVGYPAALWANGNPSQTTLLNNATGNDKGSWLKIMKGIIPVDFTALVNHWSKSSDTLVQYNVGYYNGNNYENNFGPTVVDSTSITINTDYVGAMLSGTATWFWKYQASNYDGTIIVNQFIGTIGTIGSGADLELPDVNIVAGNPYRVRNFKLEFPTSWTDGSTPAPATQNYRVLNGNGGVEMTGSFTSESAAYAANLARLRALSPNAVIAELGIGYQYAGAMAYSFNGNIWMSQIVQAVV